jgi:hypothetical protein
MRLNNILPFPQPGEHLELDSGFIRGGGRRTFWLDFHDKDGAMIVWSGFSRADALAAARDWIADGVRLTGGSLLWHPRGRGGGSPKKR